MDKYKLKSRFKKNKSNLTLPIILLSMLFIGIGFAYIQSTLSINGSTEIAKIGWNIYFDNVRSISHSESLEIKETPIIDASGKAINFSLGISDKSDFYQFYVDVVNDGELTGEVSDIYLNLNGLEKFFDYSVKYSTGKVVKKGDILRSGKKVALKVYIGLKNNVDLTLLPADANYTFSFGIPYVENNNFSTCQNVQILGQTLSACLDDEKSEFVSSSIDYYNGGSDTNGKGLYILNTTINDDYPVYFYRGDIDTNNVLFGGYCWKIVRTTETGGTKMIYNGLPKNGVCNNTGDDSELGKSPFNSETNNPVGVGYMYNDIQERDHIETVSQSNTYDFTTVEGKNVLSPFTPDLNANYYVSKDISFVDGHYTLVDPIQLGTYKDVYEQLATGGYYTRFSEDPNDSGNTIRYIVAADLDETYNLHMARGKTLADENVDIFYSTEGVTDNGDGTYSLINPSSFKRAEWLTNNSKLVNTYACALPAEKTCTKPIMITRVTDYYYYYVPTKVQHIFAKTATWDGAKYTLSSDSKTLFLDEVFKDTSLITGYHYYCKDGSSSCANVEYVAFYDKYLNEFDTYQLLGGALNLYDFLFPDDEIRNLNNSSVKQFIDDNLFTNNANFLNYLNYLEDTVWCNNRESSDRGALDPIKGFDQLNYYYYSKKDEIDFSCENKNDRFTVNPANGNGKLTYPTGLITFAEASLAGVRRVGYKSYLFNGNIQWMMTPYSSENYSRVFTIDGDNYGRHSITSTYGVRPMISLKNGIVATGGNGTATNPYVIS